LNVPSIAEINQFDSVKILLRIFLVLKCRRR
jgi:hypothetical protein